MARLRTPWRGVASMFALNGVLLGAWASRIPAFVEYHGLNSAQLGLVLLSMAAGALVSFPLAGRLTDNLGAVTVTRWIAVGYTFTLVLLALAPGPVWLAAALFVFGANHGAMDVTMNAWAAEVERRIDTPVMASFHAMWSLGAGAGAASGFLAASFGVPVLAHFFLTTVVFAILLFPFALIPWVSDTKAHEEGAPVFVLPKGRLVIVGFIAGCAALGEGAVADWSAIFLVTVSGTTEAQATLGFAVFSVAMVGMRMVSDRIVARFGALLVGRLSGAVAAAGVMLLVSFGTLPAALTGFALMGLGYASMFPLAMSRGGNDPDVPPGQGIASVATLGYGGLLLGPPLVGFVAEATSLSLAFGLIGLLAVAMSALSGVLVRR